MSVTNKSEKYFKFIVYLVVVILINAASITIFFRLDLTGNRIYSISKASKIVVSTLKEPLTINVFFTRNLPPPYNNVERYLRDLLEEYSIYSNSYFNYRFYDVSAEGGEIASGNSQQELARNYGISPVQIQMIEQDQVKFQKAYMGLVIIHGDMIEKIPTISSTDKLEYQLTTAIQKLNNKISALLRISDKIQIKLYLSSSLKNIAPYIGLNKLSDLSKEIEKIAEKINNQSYGKLNFEYIDPKNDTSIASTLKKYNILNLKWPAIPEKNIPAGDGYIGLIMTYGEKRAEIPIINVLRIPIIGTQYQMLETSQIEEIIAGNIETLIDINQDMGYLADHGTVKLYSDNQMSFGRRDFDSAGNFRTLASQNYTIKSIKFDEKPVSDTFDSLVIAGPKEKFTDYDLFQIDQYLMRGKSLAVFIDSFRETNTQQGQMGMGGPSYEPLDTGLEKLLEHYGIQVKKSYVLDESSFKQRVPQEYGGGEQNIYFAPIVKQDNINSKLAFMKNIKGLIMMKNSPIKIDEEKIKKNKLNAYRILASSLKSWEMKDQINLNPMFIRPPGEKEQSSMPLSYLLQGEFPSYFEGKPIPEKPEKKQDSKDEKDVKEKDIKEEKDKKTSSIDMSKIEGEGKVISKGKPGKIFIIGSSELLKDNMIDEEGKTPNANFVMNVLDTLNNRDEIAVMRSKEQNFNPLKDIGAGIKMVIKSFNIVGLPVFVIILGLIVYFSRQARKNRIKEIFQK